MRITRNALRALNVCPQYLRVFAARFPTSEYPDGVELNQETCVAHFSDFDWDWAVSNLLNWDGRQEHERLVQSRSSEARAFGTGVTKRAAIFGHLFDTRPDLRASHVDEAVRTADERADRDAAREVESCREEIRSCEREVKRWQRNKAAQEERLPELERLAAGAEQRIAARAAERAAADVAAAETRLERLRAAAEEATAALVRLRDAAPTTEAATAEPKVTASA